MVWLLGRGREAVYVFGPGLHLHYRYRSFYFPITEDNEGVIPNGPVLAWEHMIHTKTYSAGLSS